MDVVETAAGCRALLEQARAAGRVVGLVPTMGALHDGHTSLMARARAECDVVAVSIFVNPLQFGDPEDIAHYPRTLERDLLVCAEAGADVVFVPTVREMYPSWPAAPSTTVSVGGVSDALGGCVASGPLRRRRHRGRQAVRHRRPVPGLLRPEGLPAAGGRAAPGPRAVAARSRWSGAPSSARPTGWPSRAATSGCRPTSGRRRPCSSRALAAGRAAVAAGERSAPRVAGPCAPSVAAEPLVRARLRGGGRRRHAGGGRRHRRSPARSAC